MADILDTYPSHAAAREHSAALRAAGVPSRRVRRLAAARQRDARIEPVGGFAGPVAPDAPIGTFANVSVTRRRGAGSFAGDASRQRQGSFSDSDRPLVVSYEDGAERSRASRPGRRSTMRPRHSAVPRRGPSWADQVPGRSLTA